LGRRIPARWRNPPWTRVLDECRDAGYQGIELGPIGYLPEDPARLGEALASLSLALVGGVLFRPFHDAALWPEVMEAAGRTCRVLSPHGARHLVLIDSISARRAPTVGRPSEADQLSAAEWAGFVERFRTVARMGTEEYGLIVSVHPHAAGFLDFEPEVSRSLRPRRPRS
jgi:inosose dehydratase